jgi:hypothetical protein
MIKVKVVKAKDLAGDESDLDPYVVLMSGTSNRFTTKVLSKTKNPEWKEEFDVDVSESGRLIVTVWDKNYVAVDTFLGLAPIEVSNVKVDGIASWFNLQARPGKDDFVTGQIKIEIYPGNAMRNTLSSSDVKKSDALVKQRIETTLRAGSLELDLTGCDLQQTPGPLRVRTDWLSVDMGFNKFLVFPEMNEFAQLQQLWLGGNNIQEINNSVSVLVNLKKLYVNGNKLVRITQFISCLSKLEIFDLSNNQLASIPPEVGSIPTLEELLLGGNPLKSIPGEIGNLAFLEKLDLNGCQLQEIPKEFAGLIRLLVLDLGTNQIRQLPAEIGAMSRLVELNLSDNLLTDLPLSMGNCVNLGKVILERNQIKDEELLRKYNIGTDHLKDYLQKKLFAFDQEQKRRQRMVERRKNAAGKLKKDQEEPKEEPIEEKPIEIPEENLPPQERYDKARNQAINSMFESKKVVITMKRALARTGSLENIILIAKAIRELIPHMNRARDEMATIPKPQPPNFFGNESKVDMLKKTTAVAIRECETVLEGINSVIQVSSPLEKILVMREVLVSIVRVLQLFEKEIPEELKDNL